MPVSRALFGKTQTRRDFIAVATPRPFLSVWEQWLQSSVAASREALRERWNDAFLTAPIWRFWLGAEVCGDTVLGALMPSMDGVGRYFPLTLAMIAEGGAVIPPPEQDAQSPWFDRAEDFLLSTLDMRDHEALLAAFGEVTTPAVGAVAAPDNLRRLDGAASHITVGGLDFERGFAVSREADAARAAASSTFWWTAGGEGYPPCGLSCLRLPAPSLFASMLTGSFAPGGQGDE